MNDTDFVATIQPWFTDSDGPLRARLALAIRQAIDSGQLSPGTRLPPERSLAASLHVSRPTVSAVVDDLRQAGLLASRQGSGSWVAGGLDNPGPTVPFLERVQLPGSIDLASATAPDASLVPPFRIEATDLFGTEPSNGLTPVGTTELRTAIAQRASRFVATDAGEVIVTSGAHQALALVIAALAARGSTVLLEETTYGGLVDMVHANGCHPVPIPRDEDGPCADALAELIDTHRPSVVVLVSSVHSPSGQVAPENRCSDLADVLADVDCHVVLDETYAELEFAPTSRHLSTALGDRAIRTGSLSKTLWTGLRIGWITAPVEVCVQLTRRRWQQFDLGPSVPSQLVAREAVVGIDGVIGVRRTRLAERSDWVRTEIERRFPSWRPHRVDGGLAMWVDVAMDGEVFAQRAASRGVAVLAGSACRVDQQPCDQIRICFDRPIDVLEDALDRLL